MSSSARCGMKIFLSVLSDPLPESSIRALKKTISVLEAAGIQTGMAAHPEKLLAPEERAREWNQAVYDGTDWIFDVSGGNLANLCLPYLDFEAYGRSNTVFAGFSDLSCLLNACLKVSGREVLLYAFGYEPDPEKLIRLILSKPEHSGSKEWQAWISRINSQIEIRIPEGSERLDFRSENPAYFGGNIRCFLKLASTKWFPDFNGGVLVLEGMGTGREEFLSLLMQLKLSGLLERSSAVLFGRFNRILSETGSEAYPVFLKQALDYLQIDLPWAFTFDIGHFSGEKPLMLTLPEAGEAIPRK